MPVQAGDAVHILVPDLSEVVLPFYLLGVPHDGRHDPGVAEQLPEILGRIAPQGLLLSCQDHDCPNGLARCS